MKTTTIALQTTLALTAGIFLLNGCGMQDLTDEVTQGTSGYDAAGNGTYGGSGGGSDSFTITQTQDGFVIDWVKKEDGYGEIIYTDDLSKPRGNGYPFTNDYAGTYTLTCEFTGVSSDNTYVGYSCGRPDVTYGTSVKLKKGVQYQWLLSQGIDHEHGETEYVMEYSGNTLTIE